MAALGGMGLGAVAMARVVKTKATATKGAAGGSSEEKNLFDWIWGTVQKQDQFYETDPILKKVEEKGANTGTTGTVSQKSTKSVSVPEKKSGGFGGIGGLFAKK